MVSKIDNFTGENRFLSNFFPSPMVFNGVVWPTVEHAFQAAKTTDSITAECIRLADTPGRAKRLGRAIFPYVFRKDWEDVKVSVMRDLCIHKFAQNPDLLVKLKETGDAELIEGNVWGDTFWGVCNGVGENNLGKILMEIRDA